MSAARLRYSLFAALAIALAAFAAPSFPPLTGRVVDEAHLLSPAAREQLARGLAEHERKTTEQVVVVTLPSLQGYPIEDYGYQLGRYWGIGRAKENNGTLFIVAPTERAVRIEVGYGLEGRLTDAITNNIIQTQVLPAFRKGDYQSGIVDGARAILGALDGSYVPSGHAQQRSASPLAVGIWLFLLLLVVLVILPFMGYAQTPGLYRRNRYDDWGGGGFGGGGYGGGDGGFGGGGGSFGGGGASGRW